MSDTVIKVDSLSKAYKIGLKERQGRTFREAVIGMAAAPFRRLSSIAGGGNGDGGAEETFWALKDVSFEVKRGEVVGIIGRNGAGKSTLLKILSQITEPTSGEVRMKGRVASLLEVGTGFHPELTGRENIYLNGAILGMKRAEITRKFDEIVAFAEVEKFLDTPVKRYSSGMYVRLAFAVAAHLEPEILIVDEVLAVGDAQFQKKCLGKMQEVSKGEGRTVLFVSHNMAAIRSLCTSGIYLDRGSCRYCGEVVEAVDRLSRVERKSAGGEAIKLRDIILRRFTCSGEDGSPLRTFGDCRIELEIELRKGMPDLGLHLLFTESSGNLIAGLDTRSCGVNVTGNAGARFLVGFDIRSFPLLAGAYSVQVRVRDDLNFTSEISPVAYDVAVHESDVYGATKLDRRYFGLIGLQATPFKAQLFEKVLA